jgi:hypothetical protein
MNINENIESYSKGYAIFYYMLFLLRLYETTNYMKHVRIASWRIEWLILLHNLKHEKNKHVHKWSLILLR